MYLKIELSDWNNNFSSIYINLQVWRLLSPVQKCCNEYTSQWAGFKLTMLLVIGTNCIDNCKYNYHTYDQDGPIIALNIPLTCCSNVVITLTACCKTMSFVRGWLLPECNVTILPSSLKASFISLTRTLKL